MRKGFDIVVISPNGEEYRRKSMDKIPSRDRNIQQAIPFKFEFDETMRPNFGRVTLRNISDKQRRDFAEGESFKLRVGWLPEAENSKFISKPDIINTNTYVREGGTTTDTDIVFRDTPKAYHKHVVSNQWSPGTPVKQVLRSLLKDEIGATIGEYRVSDKKKYRRGKSFYTPVYNAIRQVSSDINCKVFFYNKEAYVLDTSDSIPTGIEIRDGNVVQGSYSKAGTNNEAIVQMETRVKPAHEIKLSTEDKKGKFSIYSGRHTSRDGTKLYSVLRFD